MTTTPITKDTLRPHLNNAETAKRLLTEQKIDPQVVDALLKDGKLDGGDVRYLQGREGCSPSNEERALLSALTGLEEEGAFRATAAPAADGRYKDAGGLAEVEAGTKVLRRNDGGEGVKEMQTMLAKSGFEEKEFGSDGRFGPRTEAKLKEFQESKGLPPTGELDATTLTKLRESSGTPAPVKPEGAPPAPAPEAPKPEAPKPEAEAPKPEAEAPKPEAATPAPADPKAAVDPAKTADQLARVEKAFSGRHERELIDVLANASNAEIAALKVAYKDKHGKTLEVAFGDAMKAFRFDYDDDSRKLVETMMRGQREEGKPVDNVQVQLDAIALKQAMQGLGTDPDVLTRIMAGRSTEHLRALKAHWPQIGGDESLQAWIEGDTSFDFEYGLLANLNRG